MPATWPADLPQCFVLEGYAEAPGDARIISETDIGPAKMRPRSTLAVDRKGGTMKLTRAQWDALQEFGRVDLVQWSLPFEFPSVGGQLVRFGKQLPEARRVAPGKFMVSLLFEVLP